MTEAEVKDMIRVLTLAMYPTSGASPFPKPQFAGWNCLTIA
jgi:hypothetical protein